jgi:hypothetical protein
MKIVCAECNEEYEHNIDENPDEYPSCPECGFGPESCSHPMGQRTSEMVYDADEGQRVEQLYCEKCGKPMY